MTSRLVVNSVRHTGASADAITLDSSGNVTFPANATCSGTATGFGGGKILQVVSTTKTNTYSETISAGATGNDITGLTVSITPSNASNKIFLSCTLSASSSSMGLVFYKAGSILSGAIGDTSGSKARIFGTYSADGGYHLTVNTIQYLDTAGGTSAITYSIRLLNASAYNLLAAINYNSTARSALGAGSLDYVGASTITAMEIEA